MIKRIDINHVKTFPGIALYPNLIAELEALRAVEKAARKNRVCMQMNAACACDTCVSLSKLEPMEDR